MRAIILTLAAFAALLLAGCKREAQTPRARRVMAPPTEVVKVEVSESGEIYLNQKPLPLEDLKREFSKLKQAGGGVSYRAADPSHPQALAVRRAVADAQLPLQLTSEDLARPNK